MRRPPSTTAMSSMSGVAWALLCSGLCSERWQDAFSYSIGNHAQVMCWFGEAVIWNSTTRPRIQPEQSHPIEGESTEVKDSPVQKHYRSWVR